MPVGPLVRESKTRGTPGPGRVNCAYACGGTVASGSQTPDPGVVGIRHIGLPSS